jgi:hypothetical protein
MLVGKLKVAEKTHQAEHSNYLTNALPTITLIIELYI